MLLPHRALTAMGESAGLRSPEKHFIPNCILYESILHFCSIVPKSGRTDGMMNRPPGVSFFVSHPKSSPRQAAEILSFALSGGKTLAPRPFGEATGYVQRARVRLNLCPDARPRRATNLRGYTLVFFCILIYLSVILLSQAPGPFSSGVGHDTAEFFLGQCPLAHRCLDPQVVPSRASRTASSACSSTFPPMHVEDQPRPPGLHRMPENRRRCRPSLPRKAGVWVPLGRDCWGCWRRLGFSLFSDMAFSAIFERQFGETSETRTAAFSLSFFAENPWHLFFVFGRQPRLKTGDGLT